MFLLGFAGGGGSADWQVMHYKYSGFDNSNHVVGWEYHGDRGLGNVGEILPQDGIYMSRGLMNDIQTCTGTNCTFDISQGFNKFITLTGNVTGWTIPGYLVPANGLPKLTILMCSQGGNFTASAPTDNQGHPISNWGFTTTIPSGTCTMQVFDFMAQVPYGYNAPQTHTIYGELPVTRIAP
jgi:hypothetical protein